ncbi:hypothetical protein HNQ80_003945 [Anaerosolibacter carboniphilus]|uniref:DUF4177 domain-containing protein n=1 Tax=Anaerosolibacter carboniphilus TaxID=1417629 RepID=A0A841L3X0_9FIRM|nr:DUF4177 domain-containing protein [Anaerosolibacter carboniphilus]MBB6217822.1 hypothetical protein [Anaerosolibacter carboniphilus]
MYEYTYVKLDLSFWTREVEQDYHKIIEEYGKQGWRFIQIFAPPATSYGTAKYYELIFERITIPVSLNNDIK